VPELVLRLIEGPGADVPVGAEPAGFGHAQVRASGDAAVVESRSVEGDVFVNEHEIHGPRVILPGDRVRVGLAVYELREAGEPVSPPPAPPFREVPEHVLHPVPEHALVAPEPEPPPFRAEETPAAFVPPEAKESIGAPESRLLAAWRDTHVKRQTQTAAFAILAVAGLAVGIWLGFH